MASREFYQLAYAPLPDEELIARYEHTSSGLETVARNLEIREGLAEENEQELLDSRKILHTQLAALCVLLVERDITL